MVQLVSLHQLLRGTLLLLPIFVVSEHQAQTLQATASLALRASYSLISTCQAVFLQEPLEALGAQLHPRSQLLEVLEVLRQPLLSQHLEALEAPLHLLSQHLEALEVPLYLLSQRTEAYAAQGSPKLMVTIPSVLHRLLLLLLLIQHCLHRLVELLLQSRNPPLEAKPRADAPL